MSRPLRNRWRWRRGLTIVALFAIAFRLGGIAGIFRPIRVQSPSMAPRLLGPHYAFHCDDCDALLCVDARQHRPGQRLACWNCGYRGSRGVALQVKPGQRVWVDRFAYQWSRPRRWDLVALRTSDGRVLGKRVLAFPGEHVGFEDGDLLVNGHRVVKSAAELRRLLLPVHDSSCQPSFSGSPRLWLADGSDVWQRVDLAWHGRVTDSTRAAPVWLHYQHVDTDAATTGQPLRQPSVIEDNLNENGVRPRGAVHPVADVWLDTQIKWSPLAIVNLRLRTAQSTWEVELDIKDQVCRLSRAGRIQTQKAVSLPGYSRRYRKLEWGLCDRRLHLIVDGRELLSADVELPVPAGSHVHPVSIGLRRGEAWIGRRLISRDVYYVGPDPTRLRWDSPSRLAGLFVAGDNQQASIDSRLLGESLTAEARVWGRIITWPGRP